MRHQMTIELAQAPLREFLAQQSTHDVMKAQDATRAVEFEQQRKLGQPRQQFVAVDFIERRRLLPQAKRRIDWNLRVLDEGRQLGKTLSLLRPQSLQAHAQRSCRRSPTLFGIVRK